MRKAERIRNELADELLASAALRAEAQWIAVNGIQLTNKPSDAYITWKRAVNELAKTMKQDRNDTMAWVIRRAIREANKRKAGLRTLKGGASRRA